MRRLGYDSESYVRFMHNTPAIIGGDREQRPGWRCIVLQAYPDIAAEIDEFVATGGRHD
jgi:hypothetical protein